MNSRTDTRLDGLEKAVAETKWRSQKMADRIEALSTKLDDFIWEFRASLASQLMTFPQFDGSEVLVWLARANQYFLLNKTPSDRRVDFAMPAIDGPAKPWKQLLVHRCPSLSWDRFVQELLKRFGDTIPSESRVTSNSSKYNSDDIVTVHVAKNQPKFTPTLATPPSLPTPATPPTPAAPPTPATLPSHIRLPTPAMVTAPLLSSSHDILQFQPSFLPLSQHFDPAAAADHAKLMVSSGPPTTTMVSAPRLSPSPNIQLQPPVQKHEWEPPPNKVIGLNFERNLGGKVVLRVRQLIRIGGWEIGKWFGQEWVSKLVPQKMADRWLTWSAMQANRWRKRGKQANSKGRSGSSYFNSYSLVIQIFCSL